MTEYQKPGIGFMLSDLINGIQTEYGFNIGYSYVKQKVHK